MTLARAFWITSPGQGEIREQTLRAVGPGEVRVRTLFSAVSRGTEALVFAGRVPSSEYERMRCPHQEGEFPGPVKYGYSNVGEVVEGPAHLINQRVFCLYPHQTEYVVSASAVLPLPSDVTAECAVLAANVETAVNAIWDARPLLGDRVSVIGAGVVGCLCALLARRMLVSEVELVDINPARASIASAFGVRFATPDRASTERDLVFHASGNPDGLRTALGVAAADTKIVELSWFGSSAVSLPLGEAFHAKRLTIRSSQVGTVSPNARKRFQHRSRLELALELCRDPALALLITSENNFSALPATLPKVSLSGDELCHRIRYD